MPDIFECGVLVMENAQQGGLVGERHAIVQPSDKPRLSSHNAIVPSDICNPETMT